MAAAIAIAIGGTNREGPLRVVVVVNADSERQLATRLEGQTNDLDVDLIVSPVGPGLDPARLAVAARAKAKARNAEVAVWFVGEGEGWVVNVSRGERTFRRLVSVASGALSSSASIEAVAVAVRTALIGLAAGEDVPESPPLAEPASSPPPARFLGEVNWTAAVDGSGSAGHHGIEARLGLGVGAWRFIFGLEEHFPEDITATQATIVIERQVGALSVGYDVPLDSRWRLGGALGAEVLRFSRVTTSVAGNLMATSPQNSWSFAVRPELDLGFRLVWALWVSFHLGADVLFAPPSFGIQVSETTHTLTALWRVQPRASLGLALDLE